MLGIYFGQIFEKLAEHFGLKVLIINKPIEAMPAPNLFKNKSQALDWECGAQPQRIANKRSLSSAPLHAEFVLNLVEPWVPKKVFAGRSLWHLSFYAAV